MDLAKAIAVLTSTFGEDPLLAIQQFEHSLPSVSSTSGLQEFLAQRNLTDATLAASLQLKKAAGQVNVLVHACGILTSLPYILEPNERVESVSLGAGNTGKEFDLTTDRRVAEFKFISWKGGPEAIRQNSVFKDFIKLLWDQSGRKKQLFLTGTGEAEKFLNGGRALDSVLSRNVKLKAAFISTYGLKFTRVGEFYQSEGSSVEICDLKKLVPVLSQTGIPAEEPPLPEL